MVTCRALIREGNIHRYVVVPRVFNVVQSLFPTSRHLDQKFREISKASKVAGRDTKLVTYISEVGAKVRLSPSLTI